MSWPPDFNHPQLRAIYEQYIDRRFAEITAGLEPVECGYTIRNTYGLTWRCVAVGDCHGRHYFRRVRP